MGINFGKIFKNPLKALVTPIVKPFQDPAGTLTMPLTDPVGAFTGMLGAGPDAKGGSGGGPAQAAFQGAAGAAAAPPAAPLTRPEAAEAPGFIGPGLQGLTALQQRTKIATFGVSGEDPRYRDQGARDFYTNLALRDLLAEDSSITPGGAVTPIERQYLTQVFGTTPADDSVEAFLRALGWAPPPPPPSAAPAPAPWPAMIGDEGIDDGGEAAGGGFD